MVKSLRFGRKLPVPSTIEIKLQLLTLWLKDQMAKEAAEAAANGIRSTSGSGDGDATD
ncbi:hypothetical protein [Rhodoplanes sp. Z2-YC6860]|uniref:hypothetical protein n=1 Tax=Rhodoplanes sp. Z2-YC6860 TaxID=674703 RepID=UPI0012EE75A1|nr:hypothetical protein [Rhodoplanes sp. Z2-YC6860]